MRLLELTAENHVRQQAFQTSIPSYAILSHTWSVNEDEITLQDLEDGMLPLVTDAKAQSFRKLMFCANQARKDGLRWFWIDSCCIDQNNERELQESIASMFRWYQFAAKCYVYLSDVSFDQPGDHYNQARWLPSLQQSRWFTRGWTLQELLAPKEVDFFSKEGCRLGSKQSLERQIQTVTGIPLEALRGESLQTFSVEEKMGWKDGRTTKLTEDMAYCLQGIFGVYLYPIYGEGNHAFVRLEQAIDAHSKYTRKHTPAKRKRSLEVAQSSRSQDRRVMVDNSLPVDLLDSDADDQDSASTLSGKELLDALLYDQIEDRFDSITPSLTRTCKWLLETPQFADWLDSTLFPQHHGFFWIRGKPGCGKSTLTKFVFQHLKKLSATGSVFSFFFNARGADLEKTTIGLYRSLMVQVLQSAPKQTQWDLPSLANKSSVERVKNDCERLKQLFREVMRIAPQPVSTIVIDALDEGNEDDVRDMIRFFGELSSEATEQCRPFRVFFSSRHYPYVTIQPSTGLVVEDQVGHSADIELYIKSQLKVQGKIAEELHHDLQEKSAGVFIWVVLVVRILNKLYDRGQGHMLRQELQKIPADLHRLLRDILLRDNEDLDTMKLCMQWILFSLTPMLPNELHHAILIGNGLAAGNFEPKDLPILDEATIDMTERFIIHHSKGLAEVAKTKSARVQFIHESVRDFLLKEKGLGQIWADLADDPRGRSHDTLKDCCFALINTKTAIEVDLPAQIPKAKSIGAQVYIAGATTRMPFLKYATLNIIKHAEQAQVGGVSQVSFLCDFGSSLDVWRRMYNLYETHQIRRYPHGIDIPYLLAERNCANLLTVVFREGFETDLQSLGRHRHCIFAAIANDCDQAFEVLLIHERSITMMDSAFPPSGEKTFTFLLEYASRRTTRRFLESYSQHTYGWTQKGWVLIGKAMERGREDVVKELLRCGKKIALGEVKQVFSKDAREVLLTLAPPLLDAGFETPKAATKALLIALAKHGLEDFVGLFLERDITLLDGTYEKALMKVLPQTDGFYRAYDTTKIRMLQQRLPDRVHPPRCLDESDAAAIKPSLVKLAVNVYLNDLDMVNTLLDQGVNINADLDCDLGSVLGLACRWANIRMVTTLLDRGALINAPIGGIYGSALVAAVSSSSVSVVQLLLERGADVNALVGGRFGSALTAASLHGSRSDTRSILQLLLDHGAEINAKVAGEYGSALAAAAYSCSRTLNWYQSPSPMVELLLKHGADINAQLGGKYGSALMAAAAGGAECERPDIDKGAALALLLDRGGDPHAPVQGIYSSLYEAATSGIRGRNSGVAKLLVARGLGPNR